MKTVVIINSSSVSCFQYENGQWHSIAQPGDKGKIWVIADLTEETIEAFNMPLLFGADSRNLLKRRLAAAFPQSQYRTAPTLTGGLFKPRTVLLNGLTSAELVSSKVEALKMPVVGVWGMAMLLAQMAKKLHLHNVLMAFPSERNLRILVIKSGIPILTRCVRRYREDEVEVESDANEILLTNQHLENRHLFEHDAIPQVLYLGDNETSGTNLIRTGLNLMPLPAALAPVGAVGYLHAILELVTSTPEGQFAPLPVRAAYLSQKIRKLAYSGCVASLVIAVALGQEDFRANLDLQARLDSLNTELRVTENERDQFAANISATGLEANLVRQTTRFAELEIEQAPGTDSLLRLIATSLADLPQIRIKSMSYRFPRQGESYCQGHVVIDIPMLNRRKVDLPLSLGSKVTDVFGNQASPMRYTELQFTILHQADLTTDTQLDIRKRISARLKDNKGVQLMQDPAEFSLINTLKGGVGMDKTLAENSWCMSVPWGSLGKSGLP